MVGVETRGHNTASGDKADEQRRSIQHGNSELKSAWGTERRDYLLFAEGVRKAVITETCLWQQRSWLEPFPSLSPSINKKPPVESSITSTVAAKLAYTKPHPSALWWNSPCQSCLPQPQEGSPWRRPTKATAHTKFPDQRVFAGPQFQGKWWRVSLHKQTRTPLVKLYCIQSRD